MLPDGIGVIPLYTFAHDPTNDLLTEYLKGLVGDWTLPEKVEREYMAQLTADVRKEHKDPRGRVSYQWHTVGVNDWRDCERMITIAAIITKMINAPEVIVSEKEADRSVSRDVNGRDSITGQTGQTASAERATEATG